MRALSLDVMRLGHDVSRKMEGSRTLRQPRTYEEQRPKSQREVRWRCVLLGVPCGTSQGEEILGLLSSARICRSDCRGTWRRNKDGDFFACASSIDAKLPPHKWKLQLVLVGQAATWVIQAHASSNEGDASKQHVDAERHLALATRFLAIPC